MQLVWRISAQKCQVRSSPTCNHNHILVYLEHCGHRAKYPMYIRCIHSPARGSTRQVDMFPSPSLRPKADQCGPRVPPKAARRTLYVDRRRTRKLGSWRKWLVWPKCGESKMGRLLILVIRSKSGSMLFLPHVSRVRLLTLASESRAFYRPTSNGLVRASPFQLVLWTSMSYRDYCCVVRSELQTVRGRRHAEKELTSSVLAATERPKHAIGPPSLNPPNTPLPFRPVPIIGMHNKMETKQVPAAAEKLGIAPFPDHKVRSRQPGR